jgi:5'-nucleotidase
LRAWPKGKRRWAINGTPADCVALAVSHLLKERPSLILAGVNAGTNVGDDANLSGTLGAALTGLMLDVPSIAFSQACVSRQNVKWKTAKAVVPKLLAHFLAEGWRKDTCLSVNIPDLDAEAISGFSWALQDSKTIAGLRVEEREDMREQNYYWLTFLDRDTPPKSGSDRAVLARGEISVTALTLDRSVKVDAPSVLFADAALVADE